MEYCELQAYFDNRQFKSTKDKVISLNEFYNVLVDDFDDVKNKLSKNLLIEYLKMISHEIDIHIEDAIHYAKITPLENRRIKLLIHFAKKLKLEQLKYEKELISYGCEIIKEDELELESLYYLDSLKQIVFLPNATDIENRINKELEEINNKPVVKTKVKKGAGKRKTPTKDFKECIVKNWSVSGKKAFEGIIKKSFKEELDKRFKNSIKIDLYYFALAIRDLKVFDEYIENADLIRTIGNTLLEPINSITKSEETGFNARANKNYQLDNEYKKYKEKIEQIILNMKTYELS